MSRNWCACGSMLRGKEARERGWCDICEREAEETAAVAERLDRIIRRVDEERGK